MTDIYRRLAPYYFQTAWVVRNQAQAERRFEQVMGIPQWLRFDVTLREGCTYRGGSSDTDLRISLGFAGEVNVELIESARGENIYTEVVRTRGYGLHHTGFVVPDFDAVVAALRREGLPVMAEGTAGTTRYAYFDCARDDMSIIEIIWFHEETRAALAQLKAASGAALQSQGLAPDA